MSDNRALVAATRLATMEAACATGLLSVSFADGQRMQFGSIEEMRAMRDKMRDATTAIRVPFRPNTPPGSQHEMPTSLVSVPDAVSAAMNGVGVICDDNGQKILLASLRRPASPGFLRNLRTR